jgi:hypothetical protein
MARRSLLPETAGSRVGPIEWAGRGLAIEAEPREPVNRWNVRVLWHARRRPRLRRDLAAVRNGLTTKWPSCQVEGQNNRPNTLK